MKQEDEWHGSRRSKRRHVDARAFGKTVESARAALGFRGTRHEAGEQHAEESEQMHIAGVQRRCGPGYGPGITE